MKVTRRIFKAPYSRKVVRKTVKPIAPEQWEFTFNVYFKCRSAVSPRTIAVSDAFGLGVDEMQTYWVFKDFKVKVTLGDIVYIVGPSGSGKSCLLREFYKSFKDRCITLEDLRFPRDRPLVDALGVDVNEAIRYLSLLGLNDAFLFLRRYDELSTGQKYRFRLAKLWEQSDRQGKDILVVDEFCSTLDRESAKIIAFNTQKLARKTGKTLFLATCNDDLRVDLNPSIYIKKDLWDEVELEHSPNALNTRCSVNQDIDIVEGTMKEYEGTLGHFHYRGRNPFAKKVFKAVLNGKTVGAIVYVNAGGVCFGRRHVLNIRGFDYKTINETLARIGRVVVHPRYRSIGLGVRLVRETLPQMNLPFIETIAVMAKYNPFFEHAGMRKICEKEPDKELTGLIKFLGELGFIPEFLGSEAYAMNVLGGDPEKMPCIKERLKRVRDPYLTKKYLLS
ncbi:MAG: hypothetical protein ACE5GD_10320, partial [Candidatus Geothermarchaeales archaeon]